MLLPQVVRLVLGCSIILLALPPSVWPQAAVLGLSSGAGLPGDSATLTVSLTGSSNASGLQWSMNYPSSLLVFTGAQPSPLATQAGKFVQCEGSTGMTTCILFGLNTQSLNEGVMALVTFQIAPTATSGTIDIGLSNVSAAASDGSVIPVTSAGGTVDVQQTVNLPPDASDSGVITSEDTALAIALQAIDPEGGPLAYSYTQPSHGSVTGAAPGVVYVPSPNFHGRDQFTFQATDTGGQSDSATVTITVTPVNDLPDAINQNLTTLEDESLPVVLSGADPDGDPLSFTIQTGPSHGVLTGTAPNVTYTPNPDFHGQDNFSFNVADQGQIEPAASLSTATRSRASRRWADTTKSLGSDVGIIHIIVQPVNDSPLAQDQSVAVPAGQGVSVTLTASDPDGDILTYAVESGPSHGGLTGSAPTLTYAPEAGYAGADSFVFRVVDPEGASSSAVVSLSVQSGEPQNRPPDANNQDLVTDEDLAIEIILSATDPDADSLTFSLTGSPSNGSLSGESPNLVYTPNENFHGVDGFTFSVADGEGGSDNGAVSISVNPVNDIPTATNLQLQTQSQNTITFRLAGVDPDGDPLTFTVQANPSGGALSGAAPDLTYTPFASFVGTDSFDFAVSDTSGESASGTVTITVSGVLTSRDKPAVFSTGKWMIDQNANGIFEGEPTDREFFFSAEGQSIPVVGNWNGSGQAHAGLFVDGVWFLDSNGNGSWDGPGIDLLCMIGVKGDIPVVGDWNGSGTKKAGVFRGGTWLLDWNGNGVWDGAVIDRQFIFGKRGDSPVVGDWRGTGSDRIGVFDNGSWQLDWNGDGNWNGSSVDRFVSLGRKGDTPVVGDWNGSGSTKVGVFKIKGRNGIWELDFDGNGVWDASHGDVTVNLGGRGDVPVVGDWDGSGGTKVGVFGGGTWLLDYDGNGVWDGGTVDRHVLLGYPGDKPVAGRW